MSKSQEKLLAMEDPPRPDPGTFCGIVFRTTCQNCPYVKLLTVQEYAEKIRVKPGHIYNLISEKSPQIRVVRPHGKPLIPCWILRNKIRYDSIKNFYNKNQGEEFTKNVRREKILQKM